MWDPEEGKVEKKGKESDGKGKGKRKERYEKKGRKGIGLKVRSTLVFRSWRL